MGNILDAGNVLTVEGIRPPGFSPVSNQMVLDIVRRIVAGVQPEKIILFSSYAYSRPTPDSDLDLLIIMRTNARSVDRVVAVSRLLRPRPFPLDILVRTPQEIDEALAREDNFIKEIINRGKVLYGIEYMFLFVKSTYRTTSTGLSRQATICSSRSSSSRSCQPLRWWAPMTTRS
jgi:predicted nucleotidyltransferase